MMRSWYPIPVWELDRKRLLAEHNELLIMARTIAGLSVGWKNHPETKRWVGHSKFMRVRHDQLAEELVLRGYNHKSPWPAYLINESDTEDPPGLWEDWTTMWHKLDQKKALTALEIRC